jgi:trehalose synthase
MLPLVKTSIQKLEKYQDIVSKQLFDEIKKTSKALKGLKVFHVNATPRGGGVAEILKSLVPLMKGVGLKADWYTIPPRDNFFEITKKMHNALQGRNYKFTFADRKKYMLHMARTAELMRDMKPDIWVVHDPQPVGAAMFLPGFHPAIFRIHIDLTSPNEGVWKFMESFLGLYDKIVLSSKDFIKKGIKGRAVIFQPAIDPLNPKNQTMPLDKANEILRNFGINPDKPLVSQVSRFDPWKDPLGVVEAYQLAKKKIPGLQLALVGLFLAKDDPEAERVYAKVKKKAEKDKDIFLFAEVERLGSLKVHVFVNAIQTASEVIIQKSTREGFGLVVTEAMWKEKAVIGGNVGGIRSQIQNNKNGFLISSPREAALKIIRLVENPELGKKIGQKARETVREKFLMPRLLLDYLKLFKKII